MQRHGEPERLCSEPFTWRQAQAAGLTHSALRGSRWRHVLRDVWAHRDLDDTRDFRMQAASLVLSVDAVCCGLTAAWLLGADVRRVGDLDVHASFPKGRRPRARPGLVVCQETLAPADVISLGGLRLTTPVRTAFDGLRWLPRPEGVVVADALAHLGMLDVEDLAAYFASKRRLRNLRRGAAQLPDIEPKAESPMETRARMRLVLGGFPRPEAQIVVCDALGNFVGRLDLGYREQRTAIEYDGAAHWKQRRADDRRRDRLRALGWDIIVVSADDIFSSGFEFEAWVRRSLRRHDRRTA